MKRIILASASPRRRELLAQAGIDSFDVAIPECDEGAFLHLPPEEMAAALSEAKADSVASKAAGSAVIIACDTVVVLGDKVFGKPADTRDAAHMLAALSGKKHTVMSGLTVTDGSQKITVLEKTDVYFRELTGAEIDRYAATGEPLDKAGAYGIQGRAAVFARRIEGDYFNVVGLPLCALWEALKKIGAVDA